MPFLSDTNLKGGRFAAGYPSDVLVDGFLYTGSSTVLPDDSHWPTIIFDNKVFDNGTYVLGDTADPPDPAYDAQFTYFKVTKAGLWAFEFEFCVATNGTEGILAAEFIWNDTGIEARAGDKTYIPPSPAMPNAWVASHKTSCPLYFSKADIGRFINIIAYQSIGTNISIEPGGSGNDAYWSGLYLGPAVEADL